MIEDYEVKYAVEFAGGEVIFAVNENTAERYLVCDCSWDNPFGADEYKNGVVSADFVEMMREFSVRVTARAESIMNERAGRGIRLETLTAADCEPKGLDADMTGRVVVIKPEKLAPEYRFSSHQLALCTGGNGARPEARGRAVFCTDLYTGKSSRWERYDIAGTLSPDRLPDWARGKLAALQKPAAKESVVEKIRQNKQTAGPKKTTHKKREKGGLEL